MSAPPIATRMPAPRTSDSAPDPAARLDDPRIRSLLTRYLEIDRYELDEEALGIEEARRSIEREGYVIFDKLIPEVDIEAMRAFWLARFGDPKGLPHINWMPFFGEDNGLGYADDHFQRLYRSTDFLWNDPAHAITRGVGLYLNAVRNRILGEDPLKGMLYSADRYGIFVTTSYYPPGGGWLQKHNDGVENQQILVHHVLPLTFKGVDYERGGLYMLERGGKRIDVDARMGPGSALFFDASHEHGVDPIGPGSLGRLQLFAIPTAFQPPLSSGRIYDRVSLRGYLRRRLELAKNRVYNLFGRHTLR